MFLFFKTQKRHHTVSENIQSNLLFQSFDYKFGAMWIFKRYLRKAPSLFTIFQKNNCYRSTTLLFGLGQTIICCSQRVNATSQYEDSGSSSCSKWPNDRMVAVVKRCCLLVQGREATEKDRLRLLLDRCSTKYWHVQ